MVLGDLLEVLPQSIALDLVQKALVLNGLRRSRGKLLQLPRVNLLIVNRFADGFTNLFRDLSEAVFLLSIERIDLSKVLFGR
jgi:hypothetical protein